MRRSGVKLSDSHTSAPGESRGGDDETVANAIMIGWVGGCPAHAVSLHALTYGGRKLKP